MGSIAHAKSFSLGTRVEEVRKKKEAMKASLFYLNSPYLPGTAISNRLFTSATEGIVAIRR